MMSKWLRRTESPLPYQAWTAHGFEPDDTVEIVTADGNKVTGKVDTFWWGYEQDATGETEEHVIVKARKVNPFEHKPLPEGTY